MAHVRRIALAIALAGAAACHRASALSPSPAAPAPEPVPAVRAKTVTLFYLHPESGDPAPALSTLNANADPLDQIRDLVGQLLAGPRDTALLSPLPQGLTLRAVYMLGPTLVLDFGLPADAPVLEGSRNELAFVHAVTNTVCLNFSDIKNVRILLNDTDDSPLLTHLSLKQPFTPQLQ
jgi:hypothetical protein